MQNPGYVPAGNDFRSSILQYLCPTNTFFMEKFDDVITCDLWVRPPQSKILATPMNWRSLEKLFENLFWRTLAPVSLVLCLGLEHSCPWPREGLSSERLSLAMASNFFVSLALASSLVSSTPSLCIVVLNLYVLLSKLVYSATFLQQLAATFTLLHGAL